MLMTTQLRLVFAMCVSALLAACSLSIEPDQKQCKQTSDCRVPYECSEAGFCTAKGCKSDEECRQPGLCGASGQCEEVECVDQNACSDGEVCNTQLLRCVKELEAVCDKSPDQCKVYAEAQVCRKSDKRCVELECEKASDCGTSPSVSCDKGSCKDDKWGCLGETDPRPAQNMSAEGSLEVKVLHVFPVTGELETGVKDLTVRVCPFNDSLCTRSVTDDYTYQDNLLTINGLENGKNYSIHLTATHPIDLGKELIDVEYQMYRTIVGKTVEPRPIIMFDSGFRTATATVAEVTADPELGLVLAYVLDCQQKEVEGVSIGVDKITLGCGGDDPACGTTPFYFTASNLPDPGATQTSLAGRLGIVNLMPDVFNRLTLTRVADNEKITSFVITPRRNVVTYTYFYPQNFGTRAD